MKTITGVDTTENENENIQESEIIGVQLENFENYEQSNTT